MQYDGSMADACNHLLQVATGSVKPFNLHSHMHFAEGELLEFDWFCKSIACLRRWHV